MATSKQNLRTFYTLLLSQTLSLVGSSISGLAIGIWIFKETGDALPLTMVAFFAMLPGIIMSNVAGYLSDRWNRRYVMALSDTGQAIGTLVLLFLFASGNLQIWHLYVIAAVQSLFGVFQMPAMNASITMLVPDDQRDRANALQQITSPVAGVIAPVIAGFVFALVGVTGAIIIDIVTFLVAVTVVLVIDIPQPEVSKEGDELGTSFWEELFGGFRYIYQRKSLLYLVIFASGINFLFNIVTVLLTPYLLARTGNNEALYGVLLGLFNAGIVAGGIFASVWNFKHHRMRTIILMLFIMGLFAMGLGLAQTTLTLVIFVFVYRLPNSVANPLFMSIMQAKIAPDVQGRVFAVIMQIANVFNPLSFFLAGILVDYVFVPMVEQPAWQTFAPIFGEGAGAGMGLLYVIVGGLASLLSIAIYLSPTREIETILPDYEPTPAVQPATA